MKIKKFTILNPKESNVEGTSETDMLINLDHIVSVKPIRIIGKDTIIQGHWLRLTNGKKYRAIQIPSELENVLYDGAKPQNIAYIEMDSNLGNMAQ
ncbi:MAG: hypothetical protein ACOYL6_13185 [Bacteriovoracaceae bacterium]